MDKKKGRPPAGGKESAQSKAEEKRTKNLKKRGLDWKEGEMEIDENSGCWAQIGAFFFHQHFEN